MLILSRELYETVAINDNITVIILEIMGDQGRIGINDKSVYVEGNRQKIKNRAMEFLYIFYKRLLKIYRIFTDLRTPIFSGELK